MLRKLFAFFIFISVLFLSNTTLARTCLQPVDFIIKCGNGTCGEGFFAYRRYCQSHLLNVTENQKTYKISPKFLAQVNTDSTELNGFYAIHFDYLRYILDEKNEEIMSSQIEFSEDGLNFNYIKHKLTKLDLKNDLSIKDVQRDYAKKTSIESLKANILKTIAVLPMLFFILLIHTRWRKQATKVRTGLFVATVLGIILLPKFEDHAYLFIPAIVSAFYLILWFFLYLTVGIWKAFRPRDNS